MRSRHLAPAPARPQPLAMGGAGAAGHVVPSVPFDIGNARAVRVGVPLVARAQCGRDAARSGDRALELLRRSLRHRTCNRRALGRRAEDEERGGAMVGVVGVQPYPAVGGPVVAGERIPEVTEYAVEQADVAFAPEGDDGVQGVHAYPAQRLAVAIRQQAGRSERGGSDRRARRRRHAEH
jgi:hypothetical protein